ncbi:MAG: pyridine nucleotide-disulfide oxidoreductase [Moraxellaceae bacterium]|jgi:rubredoxin-NAD+ reductase|nr:pyridine nucleotide-disulfide oxidoreductase [Moraxellaceae bacterium]
MNPLVIVGTGLAGYNLAKEFRKLDSERPLLIITQDDGRNYSKPMLSTGFTKNKTADELAMNGVEQMREQLKADIRTGVAVNAIDRVAKTIQVEGEIIPYGDLVLALGADVFRPPLGGDGIERVYSVNDLQDYARFRDVVAGKKKAVIIGGGLIGCEFANDLSNGGFSVDVVEPVGRVLPSLLPERASDAVANGLASLGVKFHFGHSVKGVWEDGAGVSVELSNGERIAGDVVLSAIGLRPRTQLALVSGLKVERGIVVDRFLRTSDANIYALGDAAEVDGKVLLYVLPLMAAARALAKTLAGEPTPVQYPAMPVQVKTPVCPVVVSPVVPGTPGNWEIDASGNDVKAVFKSPEGQTLGFALTGAHAGSGPLKMELTKQLPPLLD